MSPISSMHFPFRLSVSVYKHVSSVFRESIVKCFNFLLFQTSLVSVVLARERCEEKGLHSIIFFTHLSLISCCCCCEVASVVSDSVRLHRRQPTRLPRPWDSPGKNTGVGCHFLFQCMKVKSESELAQLCPTLSDPMDCSLPGSSVHGIFQARVLEWGAIVLFPKCLYKLHFS